MTCMAKYYVSETDVLAAIDYFKNLEIDTDSDIMTFLISKHCGITETRSITYQGGNEQEKKRVLEMLWLLGGLQGKQEIGEKKCVLFPNNFKAAEIRKGDFYQAGTPFKDLMGRVKDTIEKKNINFKLYNDKDKQLTLDRHYKDKITALLNGQKISLKHFTCWVYRFVDFNWQDGQLDAVTFTRVLNKSIRVLFNIQKSDFNWLFEDDLLKGSIQPANKGISSEKIRAQFVFQEEPEITQAEDAELAVQRTSIDEQSMSKYAQLIGDNPTDAQIFNTLLLKKQIVLTGVPGIGKSRFLNELKQRFDRAEMIQFHANYSYEEFIGGDTIENSTIVSKMGAFLAFIEEAKKQPAQKFLFIIDELNRGNIPQIFGETILLLDRGYEVQLSKPIKGVTTMSIPDNVYIACTMNMSDRNIAFLDLAIRRRFAFVELHPNDELVSDLVQYEDFDMGMILKVMNHRILEALGRSELLLGHAYFMSPTVWDGAKYCWNDEQWQLQFNYVILPTLKEYTFSNPNALPAIIGERLSESLLDLTEFKLAFAEAFAEQRV